MHEPPQPAPRLPQVRRSSMVAHLLLILGSSVAVFMAGGPPQANMGGFLVAAGIALVACPPQARVKPAICALAAGLVVAASLSLLPAGIGRNTEWRRALLAAAVPLGGHTTPVVAETVFWIGLLAISAAVLLLTQAHPIRSRTQLLCASVALGVAGGYLALCFYVKKTGWEFVFDGNPADFGFFLNRNHTSAFLAVASMVALGVLGVAPRGRHWAAGGLAAAVLAAAVTGLLFFSTSRGGFLVLIFGTLLWLAGLGREHRSKPLLISFVSIALAGGLLFAASPGRVRDRILVSIGLVKERAASGPAEAEAVAPPLDARVLIFRDTVRIIGDFPLTGVGLGAFRGIFPYYNRAMPAETPVGHPESDWLMLAAEAGVPAVLLLLVAVGWLLRRAWREREHPYWPLRWGLLCAALASLAHGFVDVPAHRAALGWWVLAIAGVGTQCFPGENQRPQRWLHVLFIGVGLLAAVLGVQLIRADYAGAKPSPPLAATWAEFDIIEQREGGRVEQSIATARAAITRSPLARQLNQQLAVSLLAASADAAEVDAAMQRERLLSPGLPAVLLEQALIWAPTDKGRAVTLLREALAGQAAIDDRFALRRAPAVPKLFRTMVAETASDPELQRALLSVAGDQVPLTWEWLMRVPRTMAAAALPEVLARPEIASAFTEEQRVALLELWYAHGDRDRLAAFTAGQPEWQKAGAPLEWRRLADAGKHEEAVRTAAAANGVSLDLPPSGTAPATEAPTGEDPIAIFHQAWATGNTRTARRVLEEARTARPPNAEALRLLAAWSASESQWPNAWRFLNEHLAAAREAKRSGAK